MSDMDHAGLGTPADGAILAEIHPMPPVARTDEPTRSRARRPGGNGGRPQLDRRSLRRVIESVLFATDKPVGLMELVEIVPEYSQADLAAELETLAMSYEAEDRGFQLLATGAGYQIRTHPEMHEHVTRFLIGKRRGRLSRAAMETLAIVAYRQPITRGEAEQIRGVDCGHVIHTLLERGLLTVKGRSQALGRPLLYGTTEEFLHYFGIRTLADLPSPEELRDLIGADPLADVEVRELMEVRGLTALSLEEGEDGGPSTSADWVADRMDSDATIADTDGDLSPPRAPAELSGDGYLYVSN